jgi:hypothetical protein
MTLIASLAGAVTSLGGLTDYALVDQLYACLPLFLILASSSFIYAALADLNSAIATSRVRPRNRRADFLAGNWYGSGDAHQRFCAPPLKHHFVAQTPGQEHDHWRR